MSAEFEPLIKIDANDGCRNCETIDGEYECVDDITDAPLEFPAYKFLFLFFFIITFIEPHGATHGELTNPLRNFKRTDLSLSRFMVISRGILI